jgi:hypothetical protein
MQKKSSDPDLTIPAPKINQLAPQPNTPQPNPPQPNTPQPNTPQPNTPNTNLASGNQQNRTGFTETIVRKVKNPMGPQRPNLTLCPTIFNTGNRVNEKYFIPSQFPNITKIKPIVIDVKPKTKGGGKSCKNNKGKLRKSRRNKKRML